MREPVNEQLREQSSEHAVSPIDLRLQVISTLLEPALSLARIMRLSLDDVQNMVTAAYFRELKGRGLSLRSIARRIGKSVRTVANLSKRASEAPFSMRWGQEILWRRQLVAELAQRGALTIEELEVAMPALKPRQLAREIGQLVDEGIVVEQADSYSIAVQYLNLVQDDAESRVASLRHFLDAVTQVVYRRFFDTETREAFARVLTFSIEPKKLAELRAELYEQLRTKVIALDRQAGPERRESVVAVCFVESPTGFPWKQRQQAGGQE